MGREEQLRKGTQAQDLDEPLPEEVTASLYETFASHYHFVLMVRRCPSDCLLGRVKREMDRELFSVLPLARVKDLAATYSGQTGRRISLGGVHLDLGTRSDGEVAVQSRKMLCHSLTILMNAYGIAGCVKVKAGKPLLGQGASAEVMRAPWDTMSHYADFVMDKMDRHPGPENAALAWVMKADTETRAQWVHLCRRPHQPPEQPRLTLGEAVLQSYTDVASAWVVPRGAEGSAAKRPERPAPTPRQGGKGGKRQEGAAPEAKRAKLPEKVQLINHYQGHAVCKQWTDGRGCEGNCGKAHVCDVKGCSKPETHRRCRHRFDYDA